MTWSYIPNIGRGPYIYINMMNHNENLIKHHIKAGCGQGFYPLGLQFFNFSMFLGHLARYSDSGLFGIYGVGQPEKVQKNLSGLSAFLGDFRKQYTLSFQD